jgi:hypothetical protein
VAEGRRRAVRLEVPRPWISFDDDAAARAYADELDQRATAD